jgi:hypothetical protein
VIQLRPVAVAREDDEGALRCDVVADDEELELPRRGLEDVRLVGGQGWPISTEIGVLPLEARS